MRSVINDHSTFINVEVTGTTTPITLRSKLDAITIGADGTVIGPGDGSFRTTLVALFDEGAIADRIDLFNILCVPGLTHASTVGELQKVCDTRRAFLVVDCEENTVFGSPVSLPSEIVSVHAKNSAFYFPWVRSSDPLQQGAVRNFPPCGFVAGIYARTDSARGVWKAPAGSEASLVGASGLETSMSDAENGQLNPKAINCLRSFPVYGNVVWGSRTLAGDNDRGSEWKYIPVRRLALFLEESLYRGT